MDYYGRSLLALLCGGAVGLIVYLLASPGPSTTGTRARKIASLPICPTPRAGLATPSRCPASLSPYALPRSWRHGRSDRSLAAVCRVLPDRSALGCGHVCLPADGSHPYS